MDLADGASAVQQVNTTAFVLFQLCAFILLCFINQPFDLVQINQLLLPFLKLSEATGGVVLKVAHAKIYSLYYHIMIHYYDAAYWSF